MNDLVERLRGLARHEHDDALVGDEAADEIERLREYRDYHEFVLGQIDAAIGTPITKVGDILQEIERLNALVTEYSNHATKDLMPEIERLQARTAALESHLRWVAGHAYQAMARRIEEVLADH